MNRDEMMTETFKNVRTLVNVQTETDDTFNLNVKLTNLNDYQRVLVLDLLDNIRLGTTNGLGNSINVQVTE